MSGIRSILATAALIVAVALTPASAQDYPNKPIKLIVPTAPAGIGDIIARQMQHKLSEAGVTLVVENRPGAAGVIGTNEVAKAPPDGYTFLVGNHAVLSMLPHLQKIPYDPVKSFTPVFLAVTVPNILVIHPSVPAKDVKELIAYAKANPGQLSYASSGVGTVVHVATEMLADAAGIKVEQVPYKGTGPGITDLLGGHVKMMMPPIPAMIGYVNAGTLRAIGVTSKERSPLLPEVPTIEEAGLPGFVSEQRYGLLAPAGTPRPIIERLNAELRNALADEAIRKRIVDDGATPRPDSPEDYAAAIDQDRTLWGGIVRKLGLRVE
jgi:tripartite-type tricarboxylate transporter receptor subunit TctC